MSNDEPVPPTSNLRILTEDRLDSIRQSPRQADVTDVEDLCSEIDSLRAAIKKAEGPRIMSATRYRDSGNGPYPHPDGEWVRLEDYKRLTRGRDTAREALRISEQRVRELSDSTVLVGRLRAALSKARRRITPWLGDDPDVKEIDGLLTGNSAVETTALQSEIEALRAQIARLEGWEDKKIGAGLAGWARPQYEHDLLVNRVIAECEAARRGIAVTYPTGDDPLPRLKREMPTNEQLHASQRALEQYEQKRAAEKASDE